MITLNYDGHKYQLEYTREVVRNMERNGFDFADFLHGSKPATYSYMLFSGAFAENHRRISGKTIQEIWNHLGEKSELIAKLGSMYNDTLDTLVDSAAEDDGKKVSWEEM